MSQKPYDFLQNINGSSRHIVPSGFWFHFIHPETRSALKNPSLYQQNLQNHKDFFQKTKPDFLKIMSDGYFGYPDEALETAKSVEDLKNLKELGPDHPWILQQIQLAKEISSFVNVPCFYSIFSPATILKWVVSDYSSSGDTILADWINRDKETVKNALNLICEDLIYLAKTILVNNYSKGVYFSVQNIQNSTVSKALYDEIIKPSEVKFLDSIKDYTNILHICGYQGVHNNLEWYKDYPVKIVNWACDTDKLSLAEGKNLFNGKIVLGGFGNQKSDILYSGTKEQVFSETRKIIEEAGEENLILGADCTIPYDIDLQRLEWVKEAAGKKYE